MANDRNLVAHQFKKGQSGNPLGGKLHNPAIKLVKNLTNLEVAELGALILQKNLTALKEIAADSLNNPDSKHSSLKAIMARIAVKAFAKGDAHALEAILNRTAGKVPDKLHLTGKDGGPIASTISAEDRKAALALLREQLAATDEEAAEDAPEPVSEADDLGF